MKKMLYLLLLVVFTPGCSLEEEILDEVSTQGQNAEWNLAAPAYAILHRAYTKVRSSIWGMNEITADDLIIPCRRIGDWCEGPDQWMHQHTWTPATSYIFDNWQELDVAVARANTGLFFLQDQMGGDPALRELLRAELRFLRAFYRYWQLDFYRQVTFRDERDLEFFDPPPVLGKDAAFAWLEEELKAVIPLLAEREAVPRGRIHRDIARMLLAKLYLHAEVYVSVPRWAEALALCEEVAKTGRYALAADYFALFSNNNQFNNPEAIWVIPQSAVLPNPTFHGAAFDLHYNQTLGLNAFSINGYCAGPRFLTAWDTTDSRYRDERIRPTTGINLGFLTGPQVYPNGTPIRDDERSTESRFVQLDYTPDISTLRGAFQHEGARVIKYEPFLPANNLFILGSADYLIYRYADLHLMRAEALFRLGRVREALALVNELRERRGVPALEALSADDLLRERGFELYREGYRRQDLIRFGRFTEAWDFKAESKPFRAVFPIPEAALAVNPNLEQNPGY